jgi:hypothetical protein
MPAAGLACGFGILEGGRLASEMSTDHCFFRWIRTTTNSAGRSGAKPTSATTTPRSMSRRVMVSGRQRTKKDAREVSPANARCWNSSSRKDSTAIRTRLHVGSSFGSKITHSIPDSTLSSNKRAMGRMGTYFQSSGPPTVRILPRAIPPPGMSRIALIPLPEGHRPPGHRSWRRGPQRGANRASVPARRSIPHALDHSSPAIRQCSPRVRTEAWPRDGADREPRAGGS